MRFYQRIIATLRGLYTDHMGTTTDIVGFVS